MSVRKIRICLLLLFVTSLAGCGAGGGKSRYTPATEVARSALQTALDAWQSGESYGPISSSAPAINTVDARWQSGAKLEGFEILPESTDEEPRQFQVRMKLAGEPEETVTYLVIGIDPLHIFRDKDYQKATGM